MEILVQDIQTVLENFAKNSYRAATESTTFFVSIIAQIFSQPPQWTKVKVIGEKEFSLQRP